MYSTPNSILITPKPRDICLLPIIDNSFNNSSIDFHFHMLVIDTAFATTFFHASVMACTALGAKRSPLGKTPVHRTFHFIVVPVLDPHRLSLLSSVIRTKTSWNFLNYGCCFSNRTPRPLIEFQDLHKVVLSYIRCSLNACHCNIQAQRTITSI